MSDKKDKPFEVQFAPGCFDDFEGTQEELDELMATITKMVADGSIFEESERLPDDQAEEILRKSAEKKQQQRQ